jgi:uncharacterized membrane protein (UPF0136 family)
MMKRPLYFGYMGIGILYLAVKVIFVTAGYLPSCAIQHGMIPAVLTTAVCLVAMKERFPRIVKRILHWLLVLLPLLVLIVTPLYIYWIHGDGWLEGGHLSVLMIYECLAVIQILVAVAINRARPLYPYHETGAGA